MTREIQTHAGWHFDTTYTRLPQTFFTIVGPTPVAAARLVVLNTSLAQELGLDPALLASDDGLAVFGGNAIPRGSTPLAQAYAGHQYGNFTMLGDGRAVLLGEHLTPSGCRYDVQLKGSGRTPYSRRGDGRAALGPMVREYIISEAMSALGIPTTRSLAVVSTGEKVLREKELPGAVLTRIAASHIRVGTFEYAAQWGSYNDVKALADYVLWRHFVRHEPPANPYRFLLDNVIQQQAKLVAQWQLVGFIHGVMNTDNMAISAETIDYGPCAFMNTFNPATVFSSIDHYGRYAYGAQPAIAQWNLARFAETLLPLLHADNEDAIAIATDSMNQFISVYEEHYFGGMRGKLGIINQEPGDFELIRELLDLMQQFQVDYTNTFRALTLNTFTGNDLFSSVAFLNWQQRWESRVSRQSLAKDDISNRMKQNNPSVIPRNHRVEEALSAAEQGNLDPMHHLIQILSNPYAYTGQQDRYAEEPIPSDPQYRTFCGT